MANLTKHIGLSLGADICWPICFEDILEKLDLKITQGDDTVDFSSERVTIEPFKLRQSTKYSVVLDRLTHWYHPSREWIKNAILLNDLYVLNNPWAVQSMEKQTTYCAMMRLGLPIPETWMVPPKSYDQSKDLDITLKSYARLFNLTDIGKDLDYPLFMKPYDGGGWRGVSRIDNDKMLNESYDASGKMLMHLQAAVDPFEAFVRCIGLGPQVRMVNYDPSAPLHGRYQVGRADYGDENNQQLRNITLTINSFFVWDFNSCEALLQKGIWHPIDFANPCPDSQVTSLHWHFPWLLKAKLRWSLFCAATDRKMRMNQNWDPFFKIADQDLSFEEKLAGYAKLANRHFETRAFKRFCKKHLDHLDEITWEYFGTEKAKDNIRKKVQALYPEHEIEPFTQHFWDQIQDWRASDDGHGAFDLPE